MTPLVREPVPVRLRSLRDRPAPPQLIQMWRRAGSWPQAALNELWTFLGPLAQNPRADEAKEVFRGFCQRHELGRGEVGEVSTVLHNLLVNAASLNLPPGEFAEDLAALGGGPAAPVLLAGYPKAVHVIRTRMLKAALADHGKLLTDISWRTDVIGDSDGARELASSVLVLTLGWQDGETKGRTTLQVTPDKIAELRRVLQAFAV